MTCSAEADIFITATGNRDVITAGHMAGMKDKAIVGNIGHFDNEIDMAGLKRIAGITRIPIKPQYDEWRFPDGHSVMILAEGRLLNLGCATGHPSFVMSASFTNQVLAQLELHNRAEAYDKQVYMLPKDLDEEVARLHLDHLRVQLTDADRRPGRVPRRVAGRALQARALPLLADERPGRCAQHRPGGRQMARTAAAARARRSSGSCARSSSSSGTGCSSRRRRPSRCCRTPPASRRCRCARRRGSAPRRRRGR